MCSSKYKCNLPLGLLKFNPDQNRQRFWCFYLVENQIPCKYIPSNSFCLILLNRPFTSTKYYYWDLYTDYKNRSKKSLNYLLYWIIFVNAIYKYPRTSQTQNILKIFIMTIFHIKNIYWIVYTDIYVYKNHSYIKTSQKVTWL